MKTVEEITLEMENYKRLWEEAEDFIKEMQEKIRRLESTRDEMRDREVWEEGR